jgi:hypothetical protein
MEQQLINALMKLFAKAGGGSIIKDLIRQVDENANPKDWTPEEIEKAVAYIEWQLSNFGTAEASAMIESLLKKYKLKPTDFKQETETLAESGGVQGLQ